MPPQSNTHNHVADWLENDFITSFERDVDPAIWSVVNNHQRGFFAITMLTLAYCDAMAGLLAGQSSGGTELTVRFLEDRVAQISGNNRYRTRGAALFILYRHRLAHQREPGLLDVDQNHVSWQISRNNNADHLRLSGQPNNRFRLHVDADSLRNDVLQTLTAICNDLRNNQGSPNEIFDGATAAAAAAPFKGANRHVWRQLRLMLTAPDP